MARAVFNIFIISGEKRCESSTSEMLSESEPLEDDNEIRSDSTRDASSLTELKLKDHWKQT